MQPLYLPQPTIEMWKLVALEFEQQWQFPHCIGALDGKHVVIKKPPKSGTSFFNYKQTFSLVLMALVDANYKFISVDVGSMGRFSDANIFMSSVLAKKNEPTIFTNSTTRIFTCISTTVAICFCSGRSISIIEKFNETLSEKKCCRKYEK